MEFSKTTPPLSRPSSRRSFPNLNHLSLAPLSSRFPIDDDDAPYDPTSPSFPPQASYIQGRSAPSTPGILSRSPSRHSRTRRSQYLHEGHVVAQTGTAEPDQIALTKAKSSSALLFAHPVAHKGGAAILTTDPAGRHHVRRHTGPRLLRAGNDATWFYRAGLAIASETRESKGQSWLVSRESSTNMLGDNADPQRIHQGTSHHGLNGQGRTRFGDDEASPTTPKRWSPGSRPGSAPGSARISRRGSRAGSRLEMLTPMTRGPAPAGGDGDYFFGDSVTGPDFVDERVLQESLEQDDGDDEQDGRDEEEVARLARDQSANFGGWVDRLMGWTLFEVEEDGDDNNSFEVSPPAADGTGDQRQPPFAEGSDSKALPAADIAPPGQDGGWRDAAWLLGVASKVIL
ncbi:hypothetical protein P152DRAFT_456769 [Eremomyces bilateralis CBS 781.70]|uniref:Uncharacterized protein n=1 Tax=Eremomyces bilateralis CBS 781.70 TaxID=1392243 RepID=A0A6G1G922_9PEZI|nr:uncharacterized protein P152DRAFT_456769 [Eremomyces bilateralis CBS 781.70]KAF1814513.1 hypothetical protein P152DRAFT_456769 [Eremomyces bilateralis CBS 781.70]